MTMYADLYSRLVDALDTAEIPHRTPEQLGDPVAVAEFTNDILKRCREAIHAELNRRPDVVTNYGDLSARESAELGGQAPRVNTYRPWER